MNTLVLCFIIINGLLPRGGNLENTVIEIINNLSLITEQDLIDNQEKRQKLLAKTDDVKARGDNLADDADKVLCQIGTTMIDITNREISPHTIDKIVMYEKRVSFMHGQVNNYRGCIEEYSRELEQLRYEDEKAKFLFLFNQQQEEAENSLQIDRASADTTAKPKSTIEKIITSITDFFRK